MNHPCLACGGSRMVALRPYRTTTRHGKELLGDTMVCRCDDCSLVQAAPRPSLEALENYYAIDYRAGCCAGSDVADLSTFPHDNLYYYNRGRAAADLVAQHLRIEPTNILDVGAGYGHILDALGRTYPRARRVAIEFSQVCVRHLQAIGIEVHSDPADTVLPALADSFDVVVLSHVLEHLLDPPELLDVIRDHLSPDGVFYVEVPHIPADAVTKYPDHVWAPRFDEPHITFYSVPTLRQTLEQAGFDVLACDTAGPMYTHIPAWRYRMPTMRWWIQRMMPKPVFDFLRRQPTTSGLRVQPEEPSFTEYGGERIWIRALVRRGQAG